MTTATKRQPSLKDLVESVLMILDDLALYNYKSEQEARDDYESAFRDDRGFELDAKLFDRAWKEATHGD